MNKTELILRIAEETGFSRKNVELGLNAAINLITKALTEEEKVQIVGFGAFETKVRAERMGPDVLALLPGSVSGSAMVQAICSPAGYSAEQLTVLADCTQMAELVHLAGNSVVPADAPAELRLAARQTTLTDHDAGAAAELLYGMVRSAETSA